MEIARAILGTIVRMESKVRGTTVIHSTRAAVRAAHWRFVLVAAIMALSCVFAAAETPQQAPQPPQTPDASVKVTLFAAEPDIVTPIGATVDRRGRLMVVESHSHFRPRKYVGPATDRIRILQDTTGAGKADRFTTFFEGENFLMNLVADRDGSVVVSSRNEIFRLIDVDGHDVASKRVSLARLETKANYPHNGLHGLAIDSGGDVYFGLGENLGGPWTLVGADGRKLSDNTGSGTIFRVDPQGRGLIRVARGFWNPFGLGVDPAGNLWAVDNDPDGRPPSRLIHVLPGADYGYEFRYGRTGMHPLQAWDGELPGTLGMVSGVGEAPCAVQWNRGKMLVTSWRDHQVEAYSLIPRGASYTASMQPLLKGGQNFRPVGLAFAPDGSIYVTDWGSGSYPVHGKGRVWKVTFTEPRGKLESGGSELKLTAAMERAAHLRKSQDAAELLAALDDADPATAQAAQFGLSQLPQLEATAWSDVKTARQHIGLLAALLWRGSTAEPLISFALKDPDDRVRQMGVRAITEQGITSARAQLNQLLESQVMSPRLLGMTIAAMNQLDGDPSAKVDSGKITAILLARMNSPQATDQTRTTTLRMLQAGHPHIALEQIGALLQSPAPALQLEAVRYLNADTDPARFPLLAQTAADAKIDPNVRAEAIIGLSDNAAARADLLLQLADDPDGSIRQEALRSLRPIAAKLTPMQQEQLARVAKQFPAEADLVSRLLNQPLSSRPAETDIAAWQKLVDRAPGDPDAGRRIFFHPAAAGCARCHMIEGRGRAIGPDLTMIGHSQTREHVLESILDPSREIAPLFTLWSITTRSGQQIDAMLLHRDGSAMEVYVDATGVEIRIPEKEIVDRRIRKESLMPTGLVQGLTDQELRDLVAFLMEKR